MPAEPRAPKSSPKPAPKSSPSGSGRPSFGLVLIRVATGALLLLSGARRIAEGVDAEFVTRTASAWAASPEWIRAWGERVVLPNAGVVASVVAFGEVVLGTCLFLGLLTRPAGIAAAFLFANGVFALSGSQSSLALLLAVCCAACALSRAGRSAGADVFLDGRLPGWMTWTRA
jgi:uncharacterized membrane protein YphA (DoxX/SURF4 family)